MRNWWSIRSQNEKSRRHIRRLAFFLSGLTGCSLLLFWPSQEAKGYDSVENLEVTVGYYGMQELGEEYNYLKKSFSLSDLERMGTSRAVYTSINRGNTPETIEAEGVWLTDIMGAAGVDMGEVDWYNFFTQDNTSYTPATKAWSTEDLFYDRYTYYEAFQQVIDEYQSHDPEDFQDETVRSNYITLNTIFDYTSPSHYTAWAESFAEPAEPMLALHYRSDRWKGYVPARMAFDFSNLNDCDPYLFFGQAGTSDQTRQYHAQMIYRIHIWYDGAPEITVNADALEGETGTEGMVEVTVDTPDETLSAGILDGLQYESSDSSVATVDENGNIAIQGEGAADITVSYGGKVYGSMSVSGTGKKTEDEEENEEKGNGSGNGTGNGDSGSGGGPGNTNGQGSNNGNDGSGENSSGNGSAKDGGSVGADSSGLSGVQTGGSSTGRSSGIVPVGQSDHAVIASGGVASGQTSQQSSQAARQDGAAGDTGGGSNEDTAVNRQKIYEIDAQQTALQPGLVSSQDNSRMIRLAAMGGLIAMLAGAVSEVYYFRNQMMWIKRAKRMYEKL